MLLNHRDGRRALGVAACLAAFLLAPRPAAAQAFVGVSYGYNFAGDAGCRTATDCRNKNWNWGGSIGALGSVVGFEAEFTHEGEFSGDVTNPTSVTTFMGNFMLAPKISFVQPYGLVGAGAIKTAADTVAGSEDTTQVGWTIGGGLLLFVNKHVGLKGDVRYYHSFQALSLLGLDLARDDNKIDFGRAGFGVVLKF